MTPCDVCKSDIFPRVVTREMGARCLDHAVGSREMVAAIMAEREYFQAQDLALASYRREHRERRARP